MPKEWVVTFFPKHVCGTSPPRGNRLFILLSKGGPVYMAAQISVTDMKLKIPASIIVV